MSPWLDRQQSAPPPVAPPVHYVGASIAIRASRKQVWDFIKPAENSVLVDPDVVRAFRAPGQEGEGEIQVFISVRDGVETVSALEVVHEIPQELAITRCIGDTDTAARGRDFLRDGEDGTMVLEHGSYFTLLPEAVGYFPQYEQQYKLHARQYVERVKAFLERSQ